MKPTSKTISKQEEKNSNYSANPEAKETERCLYCGSTKGLVWVHGHGQCANCGINVEECCRGEHCSFNPAQ